ncbi:Fanconi anemia core complex-associated protein 20-like [Saccostrea echinata]|uniref:Fanconi anemia core complex-associated protein 20-like n=1 Tax=Saccostrea echinata TaxID=191078 RepID=UPI002A832772|nr:Fanconi anemia core complex-associated protein 20-like [Saccostrea echinata]
MKRLSLKRKLGPTNEEKSFVQSALKSKDLSFNKRTNDTHDNANDRSQENVPTETNQQPMQTKLTPFPPFIPNKRVEDNVIQKKPIEEMSPFPPMCPLCRKRKPPSCDILENCLTVITKSERKSCAPETSEVQGDKVRSPIQETQREPSQSASTVSQCPMCGKAFDPSFTMLDIDSHLATCLSSTDDDVNW